MIELLFSSVALPYYAIGIALLAALTPYKKLSLSLLVACLALFIINESNLLDLTALLTLSFYASLFWFINHSNKNVFRIINIFIIIFSFAIALKQVPAFVSALIEYNLQYSPDSDVTMMFYSANKAFIAILILCAIPAVRQKSYSLKEVTIIGGAGVIITLSTAVLMGNIHWDPYWHSNTFYWIFDILILTVIGEEVFFRYYLQGFLLSRLKVSSNIIITLSAVLFGIAHVGGGINYLILATIAGYFYAYIYQRTNNILWPIALHFAINFIHFLFFTYPHPPQI